MKYIARVADHEYTVDIGNDHTLTINGRTYKVQMQNIGGQQIYSLLLGDHSYEVFVNRNEASYEVLVAGERHEVTVEDEYTRRLSRIGGETHGPKGDTQLKAP